MPADLAAFLAERLDETEQNIAYVGPARIAWLTYLRDDGQMDYTTIAAGDDGSLWWANGRELPEPASVRVVWDPARERREIKAKRDRLNAYLAIARAAETDDTRWRAGELFAMEACVRADAAIYSDHPAYQPEWSPEPAAAP